MRCLAISLLAIAVVSSASAQQGQQAQQQAAPEHVGAGASSSGDTSNLPVEKVGKDDLLGITVYDSPELSRTVRVNSDGDIRLPMLRQQIKAAGLSPAELETAIAAALIDGNVLVDPVVTVTVAEYRSRPITVSGAVRSPVTFQAMGTVTLLDAITRAGGLAENAGAEILVSQPSSATEDKSRLLIQRIPARGLIDGVAEPAPGGWGRCPRSRGRTSLCSGQGEASRRVLYYRWFREQRHEGAGPFRGFG